MTCYDCGGKYIEMHGRTIPLVETFGELSSDVEYFQCETCAKILLPRLTILEIEKKEKEYFERKILPRLHLR